MKQVQLFARLVKVDEAKRQVTGIIADETPDLAGEIFDYETSKPHFQAWSDGVAKASGGKSVGNVRGQHGKIVAGRLTDIIMDDMQKNIVVTADVVDDNEWEKVQKGCYTGFSIGGGYGRKWKDPKLNKTRYTAKPSEVSLVDIACNPNATFEVVKADGATELRKYAASGMADLMDVVNNLFVDHPFEKVMSAVTDAAEKYKQDPNPQEPSEATMDEKELQKSIDTAIGASEAKLQKNLETAVNSALEKALGPAVDAAVAKNNAGVGEIVTNALTKALEPLSKAAENTTKKFEELEKTVKEQGEKLEKLAKTPAPTSPRLKDMTKAQEMVMEAMEKAHVEPVTDNRGEVDNAATLIKVAHANGGQPLLK